MKKIRVNIVSESDTTVQGHGVHTAYIEQASALERRSDVTLIRGRFNKRLDVDIIHLHTIGPQVWSKLLQPGPKKVVSAHVVPASLVGSIVLANYWLPLARWYMKWFYRRADKVLAVSETVAGILHEDLKVPEDKIEVFHNTIDMQRYRGTNDEKRKARKQLGFKQDDFLVLGNGQVQPRKRLDVFVRMARELPHVQFVWVGGIPFKQLGADYASMRRLMENVPSNLRITGVIPHGKVRDYLLAANVFCLPAEQENHPMCVLEAAGAELPIILRDIPEYDDTFGSDAIRCKDGEFTNAVVTLQKDKKVYKAQQQKSRAIAQRFDSAHAAERLVHIYQHLV
jgi:1,2-diacylglycerol-3-alpha-glucose alpha-1,2-galactosyltransferase